MCWGFMVLVLLCLCCNVLKFWFVIFVAERVLWWFCGVGRCFWSLDFYLLHSA